MYLFASGTESYGIKELYDKAQSHDYTLKSQKHEFKAVKEKDDQALAKLMPSASASGSLSFYDTSTYGEYNTKEYGVSLKMPLIDLEYIYNYAQTDSIIDASKAKLNDVRQNLMTRVAEKYINSIFSHQNIQISLSAYNAVKKQYIQAQKYYNAGISTKTNLNEIKADLDKKHYEIIKSRNNFENSLVQLETVTGIKPKELYCLSNDNSSLPDINLYNSHYWLELAKKNNASLNHYENLKEKTLFDVKRAKSQFLPTLNLSASYKVSNTNNYLKNPETKYKMVAVQLNVPLFTGGETVSKVQEMKQYHYKSISDYKKRLTEVKSKISETYQTLKSLVSEVDSLKSLIKSYEIALESHKKGLKAGTSTIVDVTETTNKLYETKQKLNKSKYEFFLNYTYLKYLAGTISEDDIAFLDSYFNKKCSEVVN